MIIEKCTSEESCAWLLEFLHKIPNFNLNLTLQEKRLITTPGNVLCIGRSGTGKVHISYIIDTCIDNFCGFETFCTGDFVQDPLVPLLQGSVVAEVGWFYVGGGRVDDGSPLGDRDCEPRPHQRDPPLLHHAQG